jgi:hypothetical protein
MGPRCGLFRTDTANVNGLRRDPERKKIDPLRRSDFLCVVGGRPVDAAVAVAGRMTALIEAPSGVSDKRATECLRACGAFSRVARQCKRPKREADVQSTLIKSGDVDALAFHKRTRQVGDAY